MTAATRTTVACAGSWPVFNAAFDGDEAATTHAVEICTACPAELRERCLALAMAAEEHEPERFGVFAGLTPEERTELAGGFLQHPPTDRVASRACYSDGCSHADCRELNRTYVEQTRRVTTASTVVQPHKPNDRRRRCEGQVTWEVGE